METEYGKLSFHVKNRIRDAILAGGIYSIARKGLGKGLIGLALPAAALLIEDLTNPKGVVIPFLRWVFSRSGKVTIIAMSAEPLRKEGAGPRIETEG